ncbi:MAG: hypothetical protein K6G01_08470 [Eubacterium sp.]|nr:hypothetical protein [Eubacterium sp.]
MKTKKIRLGTVFILFTVVMICVVVLSVLSIMTAKADYKETKKAADHVTEIYENESLGQEWLGRVDACLKAEGDIVWPQDATYENGILSTTIGDKQQLSISLKIDEENRTYEIVEWKNAATWSEDTSLNLWQGDE